MSRPLTPEHRGRELERQLALTIQERDQLKDALEAADANLLALHEQCKRLEKDASALTVENQRLREQVYAYPPTDPFAQDGQTWKQVAELQANRLAESASAERVIQWIRTGAKSAVLSFTEGPERQIAYAVEDDRRRRLEDAVIYPLGKDA